MTVPILWLSILEVTSGCTTKWKTRVYRWLIVQSLRLDPPFCSALCRFSIFVSVLAFYSECPRALALYNAKTLAPANHFYRMSGPTSPWVFEAGSKKQKSGARARERSHQRAFCEGKAPPTTSRSKQGRVQPPQPPGDRSKPPRQGPAHQEQQKVGDCLLVFYFQDSQS